MHKAQVVEDVLFCSVHPGDFGDRICQRLGRQVQHAALGVAFAEKVEGPGARVGIAAGLLKLRNSLFVVGCQHQLLPEFEAVLQVGRISLHPLARLVQHVLGTVAAELCQLVPQRRCRGIIRRKRLDADSFSEMAREIWRTSASLIFRSNPGSVSLASEER